jgi:hypothetical protein
MNPQPPHARFGPLDLLNDDTPPPLLLQPQQHSLAWAGSSKATLAQRAGDAAFVAAAEAALKAAHTVSPNCVLCSAVLLQRTGFVCGVGGGRAGIRLEAG